MMSSFCLENWNFSGGFWCNFNHQILKKIYFFWCSYSYWKDLPMKNVAVLKFLLKVPKFKENIVICVITVKKVRNCLLTLLQVITILRHSFSNEWTRIIFFILPGITCFSLRFALIYIETLHNSIFLYLISCSIV